MERSMRGLLLLFLCCCCCLVANGQQRQRGEGLMQQQQSCRTQHLSAQQPHDTIRSEGGTIELSTRQDNDELDCAGVEFIRETLETDSLALQRFSNVPEIRYVVEGEGWLGVVFPGCPETYRRSPFEEEGECRRRRERREGRRQGGREEEEEEEERGRGREEERSRHERERAREESSQKIRRVRRGDVVAIYAGVAYWWYNDGDRPLRTVAIADASNHQNQLDKRYRPFFLAGSPATRERRERAGEGERYGGNVLAGFDANMLAEALGVRRQVVIDIQENNRGSGLMVRVNEPRRPRQGGRGPPLFFNTVAEDSEEDEREGVSPGGLHQFYCNMRLRHNADRPDDADVFVRDGGRLNTVNRFKLHALSHLNLAAERGVLRPEAMFAPSWVACHAILYATNGDARIQVVENRGRRVFDGRVQEGQFLVIPQFYAVMKRAGDQGFEWITFTTCHSPIRSSFTGRNSVLKAMPQEVVMNAYNISRGEAHELRWNREHDFLILPPRGGQRESE